MSPRKARNSRNSRKSPGGSARRDGSPRASRDAGIVIGGPHAVEAALENPDGVHRVLLEQGAGGRADRLGDEARRLGVALSMVSLGEADHLSGVRAQGIAAEISYQYADLHDYLMADSGLLVFLDGIEDPHNLGAIIRSCEAAGAMAVVIPSRRSVSVTAAVARASAGAAMRVPVCLAGNLVQAMESARKAGFWLVGLAAGAQRELSPSEEGAKMGLIVGSEGAGLRRLVAENCDELASIPMLGGGESLNASVATALAVYRLRETVLYRSSDC